MSWVCLLLFLDPVQVLGMNCCQPGVEVISILGKYAGAGDGPALLFDDCRLPIFRLDATFFGYCTFNSRQVTKREANLP